MMRRSWPIPEHVVEYIDLVDDDEELPYPRSSVGQDNRTISNNAVKINLCEDILSKNSLVCTTAITDTIANSNSTSNVAKKNATKKSVKRQNNNLEGPLEKCKIKCVNKIASNTIEKLRDVNNIVNVKNQCLLNKEQNNQECFKIVEEHGLEIAKNSSVTEKKPVIVIKNTLETAVLTNPNLGNKKKQKNTIKRSVKKNENGLTKKLEKTYKKILRSCNTTMRPVSNTKIIQGTTRMLSKNNNCGNVINVERDFDVNSRNTLNIIPDIDNNLDNQQPKPQTSYTSITDANDVTKSPVSSQLTVTPSKTNKRVSFDAVESLLYNPNKTPDMLKVKAKYQHEKINKADETSKNSNIATREGSPVFDKEKVKENVPAMPANNTMRQLLQKPFKPPKASKMAKFLASIQNENDYMISANNSDKLTAYTNIVTTKHIDSEHQKSENEINNQNMTLSVPSLLPSCSKEPQSTVDIHSTTTNISNKTELSSKITQKQINTLNSTETPELLKVLLHIELTPTKPPKSATSIENLTLEAQLKTQQPRQLTEKVPIKNINNCNTKSKEQNAQNISNSYQLQPSNYLCPTSSIPLSVTDQESTRPNKQARVQEVPPLNFSRQFIPKQLSTPLHRDMSAHCSTKNNQNTIKAIPVSNSGPIPQTSFFSPPLSSVINHYNTTDSNYMGKEIHNNNYQFEFSQASHTRPYTNISKLQSNNPNIPVYPNPHLSSLQKQVYNVEQTYRNQCSADVGRPKPNECLDFRVRTPTSNELYDLITNIVSLENRAGNSGHQHRLESKSVETNSIKSMIDFLKYETTKLLLEQQVQTKENSYRNQQPISFTQSTSSDNEYSLNQKEPSNIIYERRKDCIAKTNELFCSNLKTTVLNKSNDLTTKLSTKQEKEMYPTNPAPFATNCYSNNCQTANVEPYSLDGHSRSETGITADNNTNQEQEIRNESPKESVKYLTAPEKVINDELEDFSNDIIIIHDQHTSTTDTSTRNDSLKFNLKLSEIFNGSTQKTSASISSDPFCDRTVITSDITARHGPCNDQKNDPDHMMYQNVYDDSDTMHVLYNIDELLQS